MKSPLHRRLVTCALQLSMRAPASSSPTVQCPHVSMPCFACCTAWSLSGDQACSVLLGWGWVCCVKLLFAVQPPLQALGCLGRGRRTAAGLQCAVPQLAAAAAHTHHSVYLPALTSRGPLSKQPVPSSAASQVKHSYGVAAQAGLNSQSRHQNPSSVPTS